MQEIVRVRIEHLVGGVAEDRAEGAVDLHPFAFRIDLGHADGSAFEHAMPLALLFVSFGLDARLGSGGVLMSKMRADLARESFEALPLRGGEIARARVENADGAEKLAVLRADGDAGEESEMRRAGDERAA